MLITSIELQNIKSYRRISVQFGRGTTAISGANGAGKTTLVEAIGFALFDYLPYKHDQFVREGARHGEIVVKLIGSDDRPYTVERRCGAGSRWIVTDEEANARYEQRADVLDRLHDLFGIDRGRPLDSLFRDALGVPQGTFTSIFLDPAGKRKQTFDALLQIEDYKTSADYLLNAQKQYKEQMQAQQLEINRLTYETRELEAWRQELAEASALDGQQKEQYVLWTQQLAEQSERLALLTQQRDRLNSLQQQYDYCRQAQADSQRLLQEREQQLETARSAQQIVLASRDDVERYHQADAALKQLRQDEQRRNALQKQQAELHRTLATVQANARNWQARLDEVAVARQQVVALAPLVDQQVELEKRRDLLMQQLSRYQEIVAQVKRSEQQLSEQRRKQSDLQHRISAIEPLMPIVDQYHERSERLTQLRIKASERGGKLRQLQEKRGLLQEKQPERERIAENLRKAERNLTIIEEHRQEAEEMPTLQVRYETLAAQKHRLEGNIEAYTDSRTRSAGGQCPLLHERCLNIQQRGSMSLEFYFDGLIKAEDAQLTDVCGQQDTITQRIQQIKKYADALNKLDQYVERRDMLAAQAQSIDGDVARLEQEIALLVQELDALKAVEQQVHEAESAYNESRQADAKVRELSGLYKQVQQLQEQIQQGETELSARRQEAEELRGSDIQLRQVEAELTALNDPRSHSKTQQAIIAQQAAFEQSLQQEQRAASEKQQQLQELQEQISAYATLDADIARQDLIRQRSLPGYQNYLQNEKEARLLPERERVYQQQVNATEKAQRDLQEVEQSYREAKASFDEAELARLSQELTQLRDRLSALVQDMKHHQEKITRLEQQIGEAEALLVALEAAQREAQELDDLHTMMEQFRKLIKEAAPHILKAMLADISIEANRIFGEIMNDHSGQLSWLDDYEISLRRQGVKRTFAQLSGGEQMSAALAVRLALLKKLSTLNIAFFDEPTQNMDEQRRTNLAEQIRRVRGFDQLIVISHDDTFEQGLDGLVRLRKDSNGETVQLGEDGQMIKRGEEQQTLYDLADGVEAEPNGNGHRDGMPAASPVAAFWRDYAS